MIIDKKGKLFGKINIIDLCVLLILIAAVAVTAIKFKLADNSGNSEKNTEIIYTVKVASIRNFTAEQFKINENLYDNETGKYIGKIISVDKKDDKEYVMKSDGTYAVSAKPERYDVYITVSSKGTINDKGYYAEGIRQISPHSTIIISNKRFKTHCTVESVEKNK